MIQAKKLNPCQFMTAERKLKVLHDESASRSLLEWNSLLPSDKEYLAEIIAYPGKLFHYHIEAIDKAKIEILKFRQKINPEDPLSDHLIDLLKPHCDEMVYNL